LWGAKVADSQLEEARTQDAEIVFKRCILPVKHPSVVRRPRSISRYGPAALLLNWEQRIDPAISGSVHSYAATIGAHPAVLECVPAYASLLVRFAAPRITASKLSDFIYDLTPLSVTETTCHTHKLPVYYNGPDLEDTAKQLSLDPAALIDLHTGRDYLVYQLGFRPGFAFLGDTAPALEIARLPTPRSRVPVGSVGLADRQTGIYPTASPGGWRLIGNCPIPLLRTGTDPILFRAGDFVRFYQVSATEFLHLQNNPLPWPER